MKNIILLRHAKVAIKNKIIYANELKDYIKQYNEANIIKDSNFKINTTNHKNHILICSTLKRSIQTSQLFDQKLDFSNNLFNEAQLPYTNKKLFKLPINIWLIIFRTLWFLSYNKNSQSYSQTKKRAKEAANILIKKSKENDIVLIGHGIMNILIKKELKKSKDYNVQFKIL